MSKWPTIPIAELTLPVEQRDPRLVPATEFRYVDIAAVDNKLKAIVGTKQMTGANAPSRARKVIKSGDVIVSMVRPNLNAVALVPQCLDNEICSTGFSVLRPSKRIRGRYLFAFTKSQIFIDQLVSKTTGASYPAVTDKEIKEVLVPLPTLEEQERLIKIFDEVEDLRNLRLKSDTRTAGLIPALFHEMFDQSEFVEKTIGDLLNEGGLLLHKDGNHGSLYPRASDFGDHGVPFLSASCVGDEGAVDHAEVKLLSDEKAKLLRHGWIEQGDVLLAHNATVGKVAYYEGEYGRALIGTSLTAFRVNREKINPRYLWAVLRDAYFQRQLETIMKQALRNQVPITAQRNLKLRVPPLPIQEEFAERVAEIRTITFDQAASRLKLEALSGSLLHRAFNGDLQD